MSALVKSLAPHGCALLHFEPALQPGKSGTDRFDSKFIRTNMRGRGRWNEWEKRLASQLRSKAVLVMWVHGCTLKKKSQIARKKKETVPPGAFNCILSCCSAEVSFILFFSIAVHAMMLPKSLLFLFPNDRYTFDLVLSFVFLAPGESFVTARDWLKYVLEKTALLVVSLHLITVLQTSKPLKNNITHISFWHLKGRGFFSWLPLTFDYYFFNNQLGF